jgi:hypothetical protein
MATFAFVATQEWAMKQFLAVAGLSVLTLIVMDSSQVVIGPKGLVIKAGQAMAADLRTPPPPVAAPVGKGKAPIIGKGKGKAPTVVARA